jgi:hypothetical protein
MKSVTTILVVGVSSIAGMCSAYELQTHATMTSKAAQQANSLKQGGSTLKDLGLDQIVKNGLGDYYFDVTGRIARKRIPDTFENQRMPADTDQKTIGSWLMRGAIREDDLSLSGCYINSGFSLWHGRELGECNPQDDPPNIDRVVNHFYDPVNDIGLTSTFVSGIKSIDWAMGTNDVLLLPNEPNLSRRNHFSAIDARRAMYSALTGKEPNGDYANEERRTAWWATTFRSLGDMMHLLQDAAQPQHTKNEGHPGSVLEAYIEARAAGKKEYKIDGGTVTPSSLNLSEYEAPQLNRYVNFWTTARLDQSLESGRGLADYTNRTMFTPSTLPGSFGPSNYVLPSRNISAYQRVELPETQGVVAHFASQHPETQIGNRGARMFSESVLADFGFASLRRYALTRANFDDQVELLLPRAVGYSTGLLDYFFRGKIDLYYDELKPLDGYTLRNLGNEPIDGTFALYYDANDGNRYPVFGMDAKPVKWKTNGTILPNTELPVTASFNTPTDAKNPEEYILVFNGQMGEEKEFLGDGADPESPDTFASKGAVAGKVLTAPQSALYLAGIDDQTRPMILKADAAGVRIIYGFDANNQPINTGERPPLMDAFPANGEPMGDARWNKQVVFEKGLRGMRYRVDAVTNHSYLFARAPDQKWVKKFVGASGWVARPANEPGIEYEFKIQYGLQYRRCNGYAVTSCSSYQEFKPQDEELAAYVAGVAGAAVNGDGTKVCGIAARRGFQGELNPANPPVRSTYTQTWRNTDRASLVCLQFTFANGAVSVAKALQVEFEESAAEGGGQFYRTEIDLVFQDSSSAATNHGGVNLGYVEGKLLHVTTESAYSEAISVIDRQPKPTPNSWSTKWQLPQGSLTASGNCSAPTAALSGLATAAAPYQTGGPGTHGMSLLRALTPRVEDAIHLQSATSCGGASNAVTVFRNEPLDDGQYVIDSSPNGEIFFARSNLSTVIHEPKPFGVKPIGAQNPLPSNLRKLVGAMWL